MSVCQPAADAEWVHVPAIESPDFGCVEVDDCDHGRGGSLFPAIFSDRTEITMRVHAFAELWCMVREHRSLTNLQWEQLMSHHMLLPAEAPPDEKDSVSA